MADDAAFETIRVTPVTPVVGAEIDGVDLTKPLTDPAVREIHAALMAHGVVFFRDQPIKPPRQAEFARRFGRLRVARRAAFELHDEVPEMQVLVNDEARPPNVNHYHSDGIFRGVPEFAAVLRAVEVPAAGGDTIFVSTQKAYDALSDDMKTFLEGKRAWHDFQKLHGSPAKARSWEGEGAARMECARRQNPPVTHPQVRTHPVSGRKSLYLSEGFTSQIDGLPAVESQGVLDFLYRHVALPEFQCRFHWRADSIAFWVNRATLHYAVADYWPQRRIMNRVTIETDALGSGDAWPDAAAA